jgi:hypothetical protein
MACGFFGTLIALERAVALRRPWGLAAPVAAGLGGVLAWSTGSVAAAGGAWIAAGALLVALYVLAGRTRAWSLPLKVEIGAALVWAWGTAAWIRGDIGAATIGWMAFLVGTIAGERRELMLLVRLSPAAQRSFLAVGALAAAGVTTASAAMWWLACAALAAWLLRFDLAPRQRRREGWVGHTGTCLTVGYAWLLVAAILGTLGLWRAGGAAALAPHALLLGFVFAMVFGHAPIMLPALAGVRPRFTPWALAPLWVMAASLFLRGAALEAGNASWLALAGAGHAGAILAFALLMARASWHAGA